jgi:hypothetical protein
VQASLCERADFGTRVKKEAKSNSITHAHTPYLRLILFFLPHQDWSSMCAAHLFTNRNFYGTLGLAYIGTLCTKENTGFHSSYGVPQVNTVFC